jgi:lactocepin
MMKKRKGLPFKVLSTTALATMLLTSTGFAEGIGTNHNPAPSVEEIVNQGQKIFLDEQKKASEAAADQFGYKDLKKEGLAKPYKPNEKVRLIVEVEQSDTAGQSKKNKKEKFKQKQDHVIAQISKNKTVGKVKNRFYESLNGFSIETEFRNLKEIQATPGVTNVHIARTFQPSMGASKELVQAQKVWEEYGYEGEGLLVAIVDSGIDYSHQDMKLTEKGKEKQKWTQDPRGNRRYIG